MTKNLKMIFLGAPGAGKGTQSDIVAEKYGIPTISTGVMIREAIKNNTEMGLAAKAYTEKGALVPDEVVIGIISESKDPLTMSDEDSYTMEQNIKDIAGTEYNKGNKR